MIRKFGDIENLEANAEIGHNDGEVMTMMVKKLKMSLVTIVPTFILTILPSAVWMEVKRMTHTC